MNPSVVVVLSVWVGIVASYSPRAFAVDTESPLEVSSPLEKVFVPGEYDDNDNVEIVLMGYFPNTCYKTGKVEYQLDRTQNQINIWATSYSYSQKSRFCASGRIPFVQKVNLGLLEMGRYEVNVNARQVLQSQLQIQEHRVSSPDDFLYAPVENAVISKAQPSSSGLASSHEDGPRVTLSGSFPMMFVGCMKMERVAIVKEKDDLLVIRPIARIAYGDECQSDEYLQFAETVELPDDLPSKSLIHVRVTNGNSLNVMLD